MIKQYKIFSFFKGLFCLTILSSIGINSVYAEEKASEEIPVFSFEEEQILPQDTPVDSIISENNKILKIEQNLESNSVQDENVILSEELKAPLVKKITYSWEDFRLGKPCTSYDIFNTENHTMQTLIFSYCNQPQNDVWNNLFKNFRQAKKEFLIQKTIKENKTLVKYLKIIPYLLFDIHDLNATENDEIGKLNQIETALFKRDPKQMVKIINSIQNDSLKLALQSISKESNDLLKIQKELSTMEVTND